MNFKDNYSEVAEYRNKHNISSCANFDDYKAGVRTLTLIDEQGELYMYWISEEPDYKSPVELADGRKNYYPNGSSTELIQSTSDKKYELKILPDGT